jgi:hypothetical protein
MSKRMQSRIIEATISTGVVDIANAMLETESREVIQATLSAPPRRILIPDAPGKYHTESFQDLVYGTLPDGGVRIPLGVWPRCAAALRSAGFDVRVEEQFKHSTTFQIDADYLETIPEDDQHHDLLHAVAEDTLRRGILVVRPRQWEDVIAHLCRLFPRARILIAVAPKRKLRSLLDDLDETLQARVDLLSRVFGVSARRIAQAHSARNSQQEIIILHGAHRMVGKVVREAIHMIMHRIVRLYGLVPPGYVPAPEEVLHLECITGPQLYPARDEGPAPRVVMLKTQCGALPAHGDEDDVYAVIAQKRRLYWQNKQRNQQIAAVAQSILEGKTPYCAAVGAQDDEQRTPSVCVLVENTEHAQALSALLPEWKVHNACGHSAQPRIKIVPGKGVIVTTTRFHLSGCSADVVVVASGMPVSGPEVSDKKRCNFTLVVDFMDRFHDDARQQSAERENHYIRRGFIVDSQHQNE